MQFVPGWNRSSANARPRRDIRTAESEWINTRNERPRSTPSAPSPGVRSWLAGFIFLVIAGICILAGFELLIEFVRWLRGVAALMTTVNGGSP